MGQLMGTANTSTLTWRGVKMSRTGETIRGVLFFWSKDKTKPVEMRCRVPRHPTRRLPAADVFRRATEALEGGYDTVHV